MKNIIVTKTIAAAPIMIPAMLFEEYVSFPRYSSSFIRSMVPQIMAARPNMTAGIDVFENNKSTDENLFISILLVSESTELKKIPARPNIKENIPENHEAIASLVNPFSFIFEDIFFTNFSIEGPILLL